MDNDDIFAICALLLLFTSPLLLVVTITLCIAYARTRAWQLATATSRLSSPSTLESHPLTSQSSADADNISELVSDSDSDDEDAQAAKKEQAEREEEYGMTARQKFRKEFAKCWTGAGARALREKREKEGREERRKIAREVAREVARLERKRARKVLREREQAGSSVLGDGLPSYGNAVGLDRKN